MELDELKDHLKNKLYTDHTGRTEDDIAMLLNKRTDSIIDKLKRSLRIEIMFGILIGIIFGCIGTLSKYESLRIYFSVFTFLLIAFTGLLIYLLRRTTRLGSDSLPVKRNLQSIVNIIEEFMKRYFQFTMALIPVCFIFALLLGYTERTPIQAADSFAKNYLAETWQVITFILLYFIILTAGIYYFTRWYLRKLYGRFVNQLKGCIEELSGE